MKKQVFIVFVCVCVTFINCSCAKPSPNPYEELMKEVADTQKSAIYIPEEYRTWPELQSVTAMQNSISESNKQIAAFMKKYYQKQPLILDGEKSIQDYFRESLDIGESLQQANESIQPVLVDFLSLLSDDDTTDERRQSLIQSVNANKEKLEKSGMAVLSAQEEWKKGASTYGDFLTDVYSKLSNATELDINAINSLLDEHNQDIINYFQNSVNLLSSHTDFVNLWIKTLIQK